MSGQQVIPQSDPEQQEILHERRLLRMQRRKQRRRARLILWGTIATSIVLLGVIGFVFLRIQAILNTPAYPAINGVACDTVMHNDYHIHYHLTIYINGKHVSIPAGIGIASNGSCYYWLHTHTSDGIIHVEALQKVQNLALNDFLTIWHNGFANLNFPPELNQSTGWKIWVNGKPFAGPVTSPLSTEVPVNSPDIITLEYGSPNPKPDDASTYHFPPNLPK